MGDLTRRKDQQLVRTSEDGAVTYRFLTPLPSPEFSPQMLLMHFAIAPRSQDTPEPIRHASEEMIYVMEGQLTIQIGGSDIVLNPGDTTVIQKNLPHICKNCSDEPVRASVPSTRRSGGGWTWWRQSPDACTFSEKTCAARRTA